MIIQYSFDIEVYDNIDFKDKDIIDYIETLENKDIKIIGIERHCSWDNLENYKKNIQN